MSVHLSELFGLNRTELVAFVGAGGKSTLIRHLGSELAGRHRPVVITTTTRMGADQVGASVCRVTDPASVDRALAQPGPLFVIRREEDGKVYGFGPAEVDDLYRHTAAGYVLVEADGARRKLIKAPAEHEPVIPASTTLVVVAANIGAVGHPMADVAHRPERLAGLMGVETATVLDAGHVAAVLRHPNGGLKDVPPAARVVAALVGVTEDTLPAAREVARTLSLERRFDNTALIPPLA